MCEVFKLTNTVIRRNIDEPDLTLATERMRLARALSLAARHLDPDNPIFIEMNDICAGRK